MKVRVARGSAKQLRRLLRDHLSDAELDELKPGQTVQLPNLPSPVWHEARSKRLLGKV